MKPKNFVHRRNSKFKQIRKDKGKISDNSMDAKKARHIKLAEKLKRRRAAKKEMKESKMSDSD